MSFREILQQRWVRITALASALILCLPAFKWRNCLVTYRSVDQSKMFVPLDGQSSFYDSAFAASVIGNLTPAGRIWYAVTELTLDIAFPILYLVAFLWVLGAIYPQGHKFRTAALLLPVFAAGFDILENLLIAVMAFWPDSIGFLGGVAGFAGPAKWAFVYLSGLTVIVSFIWIRRSHAARLSQYLFFARVPVLLGGLVLLLSYLGRQQSCNHPAADIVGQPTVQNLLTLESLPQVVFGSMLLFLSSAVIIFCGTHVWRLAQLRFNLPSSLGLEPEAADEPRTRRLFALSAFGLSIPVLIRFPFGVGWPVASVGIVAGVVLGILVLYFVFALRQSVLRERQGLVTGMLTSPLRAANTARTQKAIIEFARNWLGPGFVDEAGEGRIYRGHGLAIAVFMALGMGYIAGFYLLDPSGAMPMIVDIPPVGYVMLLIAFVCAVLTGLTFTFDRLRVPIIVLFVAWLSFWGLFPVPFWDTRHYFDADFVDAAEGRPPTITEAFDARAEKLPSDQQLVTVISVTGGGIQAAGWGARVLAGLSAELGDSFTNSIFLISSTSGGSVGAYYYLERLRKGQGDLTRVVDAAMASSLEATSWGLVFPDLKRIFVPFLVWNFNDRTRVDRAWATEQAWLRWRHCMFAALPDSPDAFERNPNCRGPVDDSDPTRLSDWWESAREGVLPGVIFNSTFIEDGEQFLATSLDLGLMDLSAQAGQRFATAKNWIYGDFDPTLAVHYPPAPTSGDGMGNETHRFMDMAAVTAARLSAAFPYVTPVARARIDGQNAPGWHAGDGGYFDNSGAVAVVRWLNAVREHMRTHPKMRNARILFIQINPFPAKDHEPVGDGQGWMSALFGPIQGIISVRTSSQLARNDLELAIIESEFRNCFEAVEFRPRANVKRRDPPLSWKLSTDDKRQIEKDWAANSSRVAYIRNNYFGDRRAVGMSECRRDNEDRSEERARR